MLLLSLRLQVQWRSLQGKVGVSNLDEFLEKFPPAFDPPPPPRPQSPPLEIFFVPKIHQNLRLHSSLRLVTKCDFKYCDQIKPVVWMLGTLGINEGELVEAKPKKFGQLWKVMFQRNFLCQPKVGPLVQLGFVCRIYPRHSGINLSSIWVQILVFHHTWQKHTRQGHTYISSVNLTKHKNRGSPLYIQSVWGPLKHFWRKHIIETKKMLALLKI